MNIFGNIPHRIKYLYKDKQYNTSMYKYSAIQLRRTRKGQSLNNPLLAIKYGYLEFFNILLNVYGILGYAILEVY